MSHEALKSLHATLTSRPVVPNWGFPDPWGSKTKFSRVQNVIFEGESLHVLGCNFFQKRVIFMKAC